MRIRVPGRYIAVLAILTAFLCLLPASSNVAIARPIGWEDVGPIDPNPQGDNDGVVLKSRALGNTTTVAAEGKAVAARSSVRQLDMSRLRMLFAVTRVDYWLFWLR